MNSIRVCLSRTRVFSNHVALRFSSSAATKPATTTTTDKKIEPKVVAPTPSPQPASTTSSTDTTPKTVKKYPSPLEPLQEAAMQISTPTGQDKSYEPKITKMVDDISRLTLLEVADLNELLKKRLNIPDTPMMGPMSFGPGPAAAAQEEEEVAAPVKVQTSFTLKLIKFDEGKKVPLIKECKSLLEGMNLVQAKKFVESAPCIIKSDIGKDEAEKLQKALEAVGATCEVS